MNYKVIRFIIYLIVLLLPLYLIRFKIGWIPFNFLEVMIYLLFVVWLVISKFKLKARLKDKSWLYPVFLIFFGLTLSTLTSTDLSTSAGIWKGWFLAPLIFSLVVVSSIGNKDQIRNIFGFLTLSGIVVSLIALFYYFTGDLTYDNRLRAFYLSPNHLAMYLSPILTLSFYLYFSFKKNIYKVLLFFAQFLILITIYLTYSYGAWLALLITLIFVLFLNKNKKKLLFVISFFILILVLFCIFQVNNQKFQGIFNLSYPAFGSRLVIWQSAWEITKDYSLLGIGPGMFQKYYLDYQAIFEPYPEWAVPQPHNLFLAFWLQTGLLGLVGFIWLMVKFFRTSFLKKQDPLFMILLAVMIYTLVHGLVDAPVWKNDLAILFWLVISLSYRADRLSD